MKSPFATLCSLIRNASDDNIADVAPFIVDHADALATDLGTTAEELRGVSKHDDVKVVRVIRERIKARAAGARDAKEHAATMLASVAAGKLGQYATWDEYRGALLDRTLLLGDVLADKTLPWVGFVEANASPDDVYAAPRAHLARIADVLRKRTDVTIALSFLTPNMAELAIRYKGGLAGFTVPARRLAPVDARDGVQTVALAPRPARVEARPTPATVVAVATAYADAPAVIVDALTENDNAVPDVQHFDGKQWTDGKTVRDILPIGTRVLIDGKVRATICEAFPDGSTSYAFPHYRVDDALGNKRALVNCARVSEVVTKAAPAKQARVTPARAAGSSRPQNLAPDAQQRAALLSTRALKAWDTRRRMKGTGT